MPAWLRKCVLSAHIVGSVGWIGTVLAFLALALNGLINETNQIARACYLAMDLIARLVIVPLCLASIASGVISSLGTTWGLFKHYWIIAKIVLTLPSTLLLVLHLQPISRLANIAAQTTFSPSDLSDRINVAGVAGAATLVLIAMTLLSIYKPRGMTREGWRLQYEQEPPR